MSADQLEFSLQRSYGSNAVMRTVAMLSVRSSFLVDCDFRFLQHILLNHDKTAPLDVRGEERHNLASHSTPVIVPCPRCTLSITSPIQRNIHPRRFVSIGDEPFLKQLVIRQIRQQVNPAEDAPVANFDAVEKVPEWRDVHDELATASLFRSSGKRVVIVQRADPFVSAERSRLEDYVAKPRVRRRAYFGCRNLGSQHTTYKAVDQADCCKSMVDRPQRAAGKNKVVG